MTIDLSLSAILLIDYFFFFNDTATTEIYTLSLHDALPISHLKEHRPPRVGAFWDVECYDHLFRREGRFEIDRKSTRLNSSHQIISYAVFCLKKKTVKFFSWYIISCCHFIRAIINI